MLQMNEMVVILPTEKTPAKVGKITSVRSGFESVNGEQTDYEMYKVDGDFYERKNLLAVGEEIEIGGVTFTLTNILLTDEECFIVFDEEFDFAPNELVYQDGGYYFVNSDDDDSDAISFGYFLGYAMAVKDYDDWLENDVNLWDRAIEQMGFKSMDSLMKADAIVEFAHKVEDLRTQKTESKPQYTLEELKGIVGHDFDLI